MGSRKIVTDTAVLRERSEAVTNPSSVKPLVDEMVKALDAEGGIGLAAIQLGTPKRVFIVTRPFKAVCVNPRISARFGEATDTEGCLSLPYRHYDVERADEVVAEWTGTNGRHYAKRLSGLSARVFQHELDHLDGVLISDRGTLVPEA